MQGFWRKNRIYLNFYDKRLVYEHKGATVLSRWDGIVAVSVPSKVLKLLRYARKFHEFSV